MSKEITIGDRKIGDGHLVFIIAELGYNFRTLDEALESVDAASECGVDALKVQTFKAETITTKEVDFPAQAGGVNQYDEFKQYEISEEVHLRIFERARERGLIPFSTPSYRDDVDLLEKIGAQVHKIGSDDLTNLPFIEYVAATGKPVIFSSGMGTLAEVDEAIRTYRSAGVEDLVLLQCMSNYPIEDVSQLNLRVIDTFRRIFPVQVGISDHTTSNTAAVAAVAIGARVVEKHFALDKKMPVPDAFFSADPKEMKQLVENVREAELMLGDGYKRPAEAEVDMRVDTRKSVVARRSLTSGHRIREEDVIVKRPGHGIEPAMLKQVLGRELRVDVREDTPITWDMI